MARPIILTLSVQEAEQVKRTLEGLGTTGEAALTRLESAAKRSTAANQNFARTAASGVPASRNLGIAVQQAGFQVGDFAVQVASGQSAMRAFVQQGSQMLGFFGPWGAVAGAGLAIAGALAAAFVGLGDSTDKAKNATDAYKQAMEEANDLLRTSEERARAAAAAKLEEARATQDNAIALAREKIERIEAFRESQRQSETFLKDRTRRFGSRLPEIDERLEEERRKLAELEEVRRRLDDPSQLGSAREEALKRERELLKTNRDAVESYIQSLRDENEAIRLSNRDKEIRQRLDEAINKAMAEGNLLTAEQTQAIRDAVNAKHDYIDATEKQKRAEREAQREAERVAREMERQVERIGDNLSRSMGDVFFDALEGKSTNFWELFEQLGKRAIANLAAEAIVGEFLRPTIQSVVSSFPQWFGLSAPAGTPAAPMTSVTETGVVFTTGPNAGMPVNAAAAGLPWGQIAGGGLMGLGIGATIGSMQPFGRTGPGGAIGGTIGGAAGMAFGGPIGALVGSVAGGLLGSAFGPKPSKGPSLFSTLRVDESGRLIAPDWGVDNGASMADAEKFAKQWARDLNALAQITGATFTGSEVGLSTSKRKGLALWQNGRPVSMSEIGLAREVLLNQTSGIDADFRSVLDRSQAIDLQGLASDVEFARGIKDLNDNVDPLTIALRGINEQFQQMKQRAEDLGLATHGVDRAWQEAIQSAKDMARLPIESNVLRSTGAAGTMIADFLRGQALSDTSSLDPMGRLAEAQRQFGDFLSRVRGGDLDAVGGLTQSAQSLLTLGRGVHASSVDFANLEGFVRNSLQSVGQTITGERFIADQITRAIQLQTQAQNDQSAALREEVKSLRREMQLLRQELAA